MNSSISSQMFTLKNASFLSFRLHFYNLALAIYLSQGSFRMPAWLLKVQPSAKKYQRTFPYISPTNVVARLTNFAKLESGMP